MATDRAHQREHGRCDIPAGQLPSYKEFVRCVWRYRDETGDPVVGAPPWVYAITFDDYQERNVALAMIDMLSQLPLAARFDVSAVGDGERTETQVAFADLEVLYAFVALLAAERSESARHIAEFMLWTLGFRWV